MVGRVSGTPPGLSLFTMDNICPNGPASTPDQSIRPIDMMAEVLQWRKLCSMTTGNGWRLILDKRLVNVVLEIKLTTMCDSAQKYC